MKMTMVGAMRTGVGLVALGLMGLPALVRRRSDEESTPGYVRQVRHGAMLAADADGGNPPNGVCLRKPKSVEYRPHNSFWPICLQIG